MPSRRLLAAFLLLATALLSGCAHNNPRDPLEPFNRGVYAFNDAVDTVVLKPVATGYRAVAPSFVRTGVSNFFSNLDDITVILNGLLQLKIPQALSDTGRFLINSTVGLLGLIDVATHLGLEKHNEDFGQTLGYWGIGSGPYLVLPFLGPSSVRDGLGRIVDRRTDVVWREDHTRTRNQFFAARVISNRAHLLDSEKLLETAAIDEYQFVRDAYLQRRRSLVHDGNPPPEPEDEEPTAKPRSQTPTDTAPPTATVLVDERGFVVAGGNETGGIVPVLERMTSAPPRARATAGAPAAGAGRSAADAAPLPVNEAGGDTSPVRGAAGSEPEPSTQPQVRVVRVWVSGPAQ